MKRTFNDTEAQFAARFAAVPPIERLRMSSAMFESAKRLIAASLRHSNPTMSPRELKIGTFDRLYGDDCDEPTKQRLRAALRA